MNNRKMIYILLLAGVVATVVLLQRPAPTGQTTGDGAPMAEVRLPSELSANAQTGKTVFDAKCASCHGANAAGQQGVAPPLIHKVYEPSHHGDVAFQLAAKNGVRAHHWTFGNMPPVEDISDAEIAYATLYIRELQRENGIK